MATKAANKRLTKEYLALQRTPPPFIIARPLESNILEWHYVIRGPSDSPYAGGEYHGKLIFPSEYPFKAPTIKMLTPSGRFQVDFALCLSMSSYHQESWNPSWSVATILTGLLSFMLEDTPTTGSIKTTLAEKRALALTSHGWNLKVPKFREVFPELATKEMVPLEQCMPWSLEKPTKEDVKEDAEEDAKEAAEEDGEKPTNGTVDAPKMANGHHDAPAAAEPVPKPANLAPQPALQEAPRPEPKTWSNMALFVFVSIIGLIVARVAQRLREEL